MAGVVSRTPVLATIPAASANTRQTSANLTDAHANCAAGRDSPVNGANAIRLIGGVGSRSST